MHSCILTAYRLLTPEEEARQLQGLEDQNRKFWAPELSRERGWGRLVLAIPSTMLIRKNQSH